MAYPNSIQSVQRPHFISDEKSSPAILTADLLTSEVVRPQLQSAALLARDLTRLSITPAENVMRMNGQSPFDCMKVREVAFSQATVSPTFSDGRLLIDMVRQLTSGKLGPYDIEPIRIVKHNGKWTTLDNRRLRAFMDAFVDMIPVVKFDLKNPLVAKEFWDKKSNKSLTNGGTIRTPFPNDSKQNYDQGIYVFNKRVLNWTFEQIALPNPSLTKVALPDRYSSRIEQYKSFEELLIEEARAILQNGLELTNLEKEHAFRFLLSKFKPAKNPANPTEMKFDVLPESERDVKSGDALLLEYAENPRVRLIALTSYSESDVDNSKLSFKVVVDQALIAQFPLAFAAGQKWNARAIGSLITLQRMFEACTTFSERTETFLERSIWSGNLFPHGPQQDIDSPITLQRMFGAFRTFPDWSDDVFSNGSQQITTSLSLSLEENQLFSTLNCPQYEAIEKFLQIKQGLQLIQGPPGTGKTTTVIKLLRALQRRGERILVCAPSNKAIHILAERFIHDFPDIPVILVGVEQKLPPDGSLNSIFLNSWCSEKLGALKELERRLWDFEPSKVVNGSMKFLPNRIAAVSKEVVRCAKDVTELIEKIVVYAFSFLDNLLIKKSEILEALTEYHNLISSQTPEAWQEVAHYVKMQKVSVPYEMPRLISSARFFLSTISVALFSLQTKLAVAEKDPSKNGLEGQLLDHAKILFTTLSVSGQQRLKNMQPVDTLIVDEAGQAVEAETLIPLRANPKKCLLIGDIQQLPATVISQNAERLKFGRSMMERLARDCEQPYSMLKIQYRMHPEISHWPSRQYYQGKLENHESVCDKQHAIGTTKDIFPFLAPYAFININAKEGRGPSGHSFINIPEVVATTSIINYMAQELLIKVVNRVAIISFYAAQVSRIYEALKGRYPGIKVNTVDGFQGGENDIVIISCVRANLEKQIGFLKESKRLNVALTRAKFSLIILGNKPTLIRSDIANLVANADQRGLLFEEGVLQKLRTPKKEPLKQISDAGYRKRGELPGRVPTKLITNHPSKKKANVASSPSSHSFPPAARQSSNYKTQLCHFFMNDPSSCSKGERCHYAHGETELHTASEKAGPKLLQNNPKTQFQSRERK